MSKSFATIEKANRSQNTSSCASDATAAIVPSEAHSFGCSNLSLIIRIVSPLKKKTSGLRGSPFIPQMFKAETKSVALKNALSDTASGSHFSLGFGTVPPRRTRVSISFDYENRRETLPSTVHRYRREGKRW